MTRGMLALWLLAFAGAAAAESAGGFTGPDGVQTSTVAEAKNLPDDSQVRLTGYLTRSVGDEEYQFKDDTGALIVEIDDDEWQGTEANPDTRVELTGELDHDDNKVELDVERIALAQ